MSFKGYARNIMAVDEAIDLLDTFEITKSLVAILEAKANILSRKCDSKNLESEYRLLTYIDKNFKTLFFNDYVKAKVRHIDDKLPMLFSIAYKNKMVCPSQFLN